MLKVILFYIIIIQMIDQQNKYLHNLLSQHSASAQIINNVMTLKQQEYQQRIKKGQYQIHKIKFGQSSIDKSNILNYRKNHQHLSTQFNIISRAIKEQEKKQVIYSDEQRKKFVKQMIMQQKKLNKKKEEKLRLQQLKRLQVEQLQKKVLQNEARQKMQNKRRQMQNRIQQLSEQKRQREEQWKERNRQYKQISSQKLLAHRMVQNYNKLQNITLEEKKKKLAQIRQIHKPISKEELNEHLQRIEYYKEIKKQQKQMMSSSRASESNLQFYKSKWYKSVMKQEKIDEKKIIEQQRKKLQDMKDKVKKYSEYIKHNFAPESDEKLQEEIAKRQPEPIKRKKAKEIRQMGINNLQYSKQKIISKQELQQKMKEKLKASQPSESPTTKPKDYLQELKNNRRHSSLNEKFITKLDKNPLKVDKLKHYAQSLEERAKRKEQLRKIGKQISQQQLDELYIKALDAKLNLLQKQKQ